MPKFPQSYEAAGAALRRASAGGRMIPRLDIFIREDRSDAGSPPITVFSGGASVTFHADGRIKVCTAGCNDEAALRFVNRCLPRGYSCRRMQVRDGRFDRRMTPHVYLLGPGRSFEKPIATFLSSAVFEPDISALAEGRAA